MKLSSTKILKFILKCKSPHPAIGKVADFLRFYTLYYIDNNKKWVFFDAIFIIYR